MSRKHKNAHELHRKQQLQDFWLIKINIILQTAEMHTGMNWRSCKAELAILKVK